MQDVAGFDSVPELTDPGGHKRHADDDDAFAIEPYVPLGHATHDVAAEGRFVYNPAAQPAQVPIEVAVGLPPEDHVPAAHAVQTEAALGAKPGLHAVQGMRENVPAVPVRPGFGLA